MESDVAIVKREERYRVSVCLQRYFSDERSRAYVSVVRGCQVRWLQQRLRTLFALRGRFFLRSRGHLLPSEEPLSLLQPDDPVEVIPLSGDSSDGEESSVLKNGAVTCQVQAGSQRLEASLSPTPSNDRESSVAATESNEPDKDVEALASIKRQALALLEQCGGDSSIVQPDNELVSDAVKRDGPRRTRRRVRRRKRLPSSEKTHPWDEGAGNKTGTEVPWAAAVELMLAEPAAGVAAVEMMLGEPVAGAVAVEAVAAEAVEATVQRNGPVFTRKPRLVRSVSPPQTCG